MIPIHHELVSVGQRPEPLIEILHVFPFAEGGEVTGVDENVAMRGHGDLTMVVVRIGYGDDFDAEGLMLEGLDAVGQ